VLYRDMRRTWCSRSFGAWSRRNRRRFPSNRHATLRLEQLDAHLSRGLQPLYAIHGDEPLLALEAADAIRARGAQEGFRSAWSSRRSAG